MTPDLLIVSDIAFLDHDTGYGHPERAARLTAIEAQFAKFPLPRSIRRAPAGPASDEALARVHAPAYIQQLAALRGRAADLDPDTHVSAGSVDAAFLATGAALTAVDAVARGEAKSAFAFVRPPGHHAEADKAMGFCLLNNVAVAAAYAREALGFERVLVVDWDVHHGNGTQHAFERRDDVLFFSTHRYPFYPGTGAYDETGSGAGAGYTVNVPLPAFVGDGDYAAIFRRLLVPLAAAYRPDFVLVSAGFDAHHADPLSDMAVTEEGFASLCGIVKNVADEHAGGRLALVLEGGYDLTALARSAHACARVLTGETPPPPAPVRGDADGSVSRTQAALKGYWKF